MRFLYKQDAKANKLPHIKRLIYYRSDKVSLRIGWVLLARKNRSKAVRKHREEEEIVYMLLTRVDLNATFRPKKRYHLKVKV